MTDFKELPRTLEEQVSLFKRLLEEGVSIPEYISYSLELYGEPMEERYYTIEDNCLELSMYL